MTDNENYLVLSQHYRRDFDDEMVALSHAKDRIAEAREAAGELGWGREQGLNPILVVKVLYESRQCDVGEPLPKDKARGFEFACDYQMFPLIEEDEHA